MDRLVDRWSLWVFLYLIDTAKGVDEVCLESMDHPKGGDPEVGEAGRTERVREDGTG